MLSFFGPILSSIHWILQPLHPHRSQTDEISSQMVCFPHVLLVDSFALIPIFVVILLLLFPIISDNTRIAMTNIHITIIITNMIIIISILINIIITIIILLSLLSLML